MTSEQRLDRLERIAKLFVREGVRYRRDLRELGDKLNILVDSQIKGDERFKKNEAAFQARSAQYEKRFQRDEERLARLAARTDRKFVELAQSQDRTDRKFVELAQGRDRTDRKFVEVAEFQASTERSLAELIKLMTRGRNGNPETGS